ncbi:MAG: PD40 domain-containing protein [Leptospiraceae bacterium]|nr:PD40 domain-containing protein [Leptospiraceae bacterium]
MSGIRFVFLFQLIFLFPVFAQSSIPETPAKNAELRNLESINTPHVEYTPFIHPDESFLFFESNRPGGVGLTGDFDIWYAERDMKNPEQVRFLPPVNMGRPINTRSFDGLPSLRKLGDGSLEIYFSSFASRERPGPAETNIYYSRFNGSEWSVPVPVIEINSQFHDRMPSVSADGTRLFFSSNRPGGFGKDDIYVANYNPELKKWDKPVNLGNAINSASSEVSPSIHSDGITLYFSSNRTGFVGGYDIFVTQILPGKTIQWKPPSNLGTPFNSAQDDEYPTVTRDGEFLYFSSNRGGGKGSFDIYRARVPDFAKPQVVITLAGRVHEEDTLKGIEAKIHVIAQESERNLSTGLPDGNYSIDFVNDRQYRIIVSAPGYESYETAIDFRDIHLPTTLERNFPLRRRLLIPEFFQIQVHFRDANGNVLKPNAEFSVDQSGNRLMPFSGNHGEIQLPANSEDFSQVAQMLASDDLNVFAVLPGYENLQYSKNLGEIINLERRPVEKIYKIYLTMSPVKMAKATENKQPEKNKSKADRPAARVDFDDKNFAAVVYFEHNVARKISPEELQDLKIIKDQYDAKPEMTVVLHAHSDSTGTKTVNTRISRERALFIKTTLVSMGIPKEKIQPNWHADSRPRVEETDEKSRAMNRRVEIQFAKIQPQAPAKQKPPEKATEEKTNPAQTDSMNEKMEDKTKAPSSEKPTEKIPDQTNPKSEEKINE